MNKTRFKRLQALEYATKLSFGAGVVYTVACKGSATKVKRSLVSKAAASQVIQRLNG